MYSHLYLCLPLVLSSPTLMMHGHTKLKNRGCYSEFIVFRNKCGSILIEQVPKLYKITRNVIAQLLWAETNFYESCYEYHNSTTQFPLIFLLKPTRVFKSIQIGGGEFIFHVLVIIVKLKSGL